MIAGALSNLWIKNSSFPVVLAQPFRSAGEWWTPGLGLLQEASLEPSWLEVCLKNEHIHVPEYTDLCAYSLGWVCFGFFSFIQPLGISGKEFSVWLTNGLLVWKKAIPAELIKYTCYLSFVRKNPRERYWLPSIYAMFSMDSQGKIEKWEGH